MSTYEFFFVGVDLVVLPVALVWAIRLMWKHEQEIFHSPVGRFVLATFLLASVDIPDKPEEVTGTQDALVWVGILTGVLLYLWMRRALKEPSRGE